MLTIQREDVNKLPAFLNHKTARNFFKHKYGNHFLLHDIEFINNEKIYFYHLVIDKSEYIKGMDSLRKTNYVDNSASLMASYQIIKISENGTIKVVY